MQSPKRMTFSPLSNIQRNRDRQWGERRGKRFALNTIQFSYRVARGRTARLRKNKMSAISTSDKNSRWENQTTSSTFHRISEIFILDHSRHRQHLQTLPLPHSIRTTTGVGLNPTLHDQKWILLPYRFRN